MVEKQLDTGEDEAEASSPSGAASLETSASPLRSPPARKGTSWKQMPEAAVKSACLLAAEGVAVETIAAALLQPEKRVQRTLAMKACRQEIRRLRGEKILREVEHKHALPALLPSARKAIEDGLVRAANVKNAADVGRWLHEAIVQKPAQRVDVGVHGRIEHDLSPVFEKISESLRLLREANPSRDPLARVQTGREILASRPLIGDGNAGS